MHVKERCAKGIIWGREALRGKWGTCTDHSHAPRKRLDEGRFMALLKDHPRSWPARLSAEAAAYVHTHVSAKKECALIVKLITRGSKRKYNKHSTVATHTLQTWCSGTTPWNIANLFMHKHLREVQALWKLSMIMYPNIFHITSVTEGNEDGKKLRHVTGYSNPDHDRLTGNHTEIETHHTGRRD